MRRLAALFLASLALAACSDRALPPPPQLEEPQAQTNTAQADTYGPQFGEERIIRGNVESGDGLSAISLCPEEGACSATITATGGSSVCWMEFSENGRESMARLGGLERPDGKAEYWFEGVGRVANGPGKFGRRNSYSCLVQIEEVKAYWRQFEEIVPSERGKKVDSGIIPVPYE